MHDTFLEKFNRELNEIVPDEPKKQAQNVETLAEETEQQQAYFTTFRNIKGQLFDLLEEMKQERYKEAFESFMNKPDTRTKLEEIDREEQEYQSGETKQDPHAELKRQKIDNDARAYADKEKKKATPKDPLAVAIFLKKYIRFVRIKPEADNQKAPLYFYNPDTGVWREDNEAVQDWVAVVFPSATEKKAFDVIYHLSRRSPLKRIQNNYTAIGDKLYNCKTNGFEAFTPDIIVTRKIGTKYNPNVTEPNINGWTPTTWLKELFNNDEELYQLAIQIIRASITGQSLEKIFWLYGRGGTGKGTFQQLLINLVGMENIATLKITDLATKNRFATSILLGKTLVIGDDVQQDAIIKDTSVLFSLVTGDIMTIEEKQKKPYSIRLIMTVIQSSNGLPRMNGDKNAIDRRFRILPFSDSFIGKPNKAIKSDYIARKEVLEYLLKVAIETPTTDIYPKASKELLDEHQRDINPVYDFAVKFFTDDLQSEFIPNSFVYYCWKGYLDYYQSKIYLTEMQLHNRLKDCLPDGFSKGWKTIPAGRHLPIGFYPKDDLPHYASHNYSNGREVPEKRRKKKNERGYINGNIKK